MMKRSHKILTAFGIILFMAVCAGAGQEYIGSRTSNKYHDPACKWVKEIKQDKMIKFSSPEEAAKAGYIPCPTCKPPLPVQAKTIHDKTNQDHDPKGSAKIPQQSYASNMTVSSLLLLFLLCVPFLPGLLETWINNISRKTNKKESAP